jgi:hypothetical protein
VQREMCIQITHVYLRNVVLCPKRKERILESWPLVRVSGDLGRPEFYRRTEVEEQILSKLSSLFVRGASVAAI